MNFGRVFLSWCLRAYLPHIPLLFLLLVESYTRPISSPGDPPQINTITPAVSARRRTSPSALIPPDKTSRSPAR